VSELDRFAERARRAAEAIAATPAAGPGMFGAPDPDTGERWNAGNVLGHLAEMLPFWTDQCRAVARGATAIGRDEGGYARRREGIESGTLLSEADLRARIQAGVQDLLALLSELRPEDLDRPVVRRMPTEEQQLTLRLALENLLVGHVEAHAHQLAELTRA
jgi:hypothetical protein